MKKSLKQLRPAVFMHIQKTAGTSIVNLARNYYGNDNVMSHADHMEGCPEEGAAYALFFNRDKLLVRHNNKKFISGHFGYDFCSTFMKDRYSFTFLRDPKERLLSFYFFCRSQPAEHFFIYALAQKHSLDDFLRFALANTHEALQVKSLIRNQQAWMLAHGMCNSDGRHRERFSEAEIQELAFKHLENFNHIGVTENFKQDRDIILKALGIPLPEQNLKYNATSTRAKMNELPDSTLNLLSELTAMEQPIYDWVVKRNALNKKLSGLSAAFFRLGKRAKSYFTKTE